MYASFFKRAFDIGLALLAFALFCPILLAVALGVRIKLGRPLLYTQIRPGLHGKPFRLLKFRSMTDARDVNGQLLPDADRLPEFGRFLRASSLDELPEIWNVLVGDMSIVGPRPLLMEYLPLYSAEQMRRHEVRPGITGWAQINGRNAISWEEKFRLDVWYVDHQSFALDFKIFWLTFARIAQSRGVTSPQSATAERFTGSRV
jgi:lipopolysaccharide/colanic/teichoic acid biosynthesis glycosyltransferase